MPRQHGPWKIIRSEDVYRDPWISVRRDEVIRPDGQEGTYSVVDLKPGVSVVAVDESRNVYLTEEFHYGVGRVTLESVSGGIDGDEPAIDTARRELKKNSASQPTNGRTWACAIHSPAAWSRRLVCFWQPASRSARTVRKGRNKSLRKTSAVRSD